MKYLVYIKTNGKVYPQLWSIDFTKSIEARLGNIVAKHELKVYDEGLSFDRLIEKYPYKVENEKVSSSNNAISNDSNGAGTA